jgi:hypothetical protein
MGRAVVAEAVSAAPMGLREGYVSCSRRGAGEKSLRPP